MKRFLSLSLFGIAALALSTILFTTGCGNDARARVRVVHASPDAPNVDVVLDSKTVLSNVAYKTASSYLTIKAGQHTAKVNVAGTQTTVITESGVFAGKSDTTILAVDKVANITGLVLTDNNTPPTSGNVKVRVIHASPSAGNVDVYVTAPGGALTAPTLTNVAFKAVSDYLSVAAGSYQVRVTPTGTKNVVIDSGTVALTAGQIRTVVALDADATGTSFTAIILPDLK